MRQRFNTRQRNYIILGLCSILLVMAAGYAAFRTQLTINGTSNITSEFKVLITDIQSRNVVGRAENAEEPSHTETTATFKTNLYLPGDSITYDVTVENQGSIDAVLKTIQKSDSNNNAIIFETSGIQEGEVLKASESTVFSVTVSYNASTTSQPSNITSDLEVTLDYEQATGEEGPVGNTALIGGNTVSVADSGDGLYADEYTSGRYVYRGSNPDNYIKFNGELWRIISKEAEGTYKILRNEVLPDRMVFDSQGARTTGYCSQGSAPTSGCNAWSSTANMVGSPSEFTNGTYSGSVDADSEMLTYLNGEYLNSITENRDEIVSHDYNIGRVTFGNNDLANQITDERSYKWNGEVGLISVSDYLNANSDIELCGTNSKSFTSYLTCRNTNWMYISGRRWWTLSPNAEDTDSVWNINHDGAFQIDRDYTLDDVRPAVFLSSSLSFSGSGTQSDPYRIN